MFPVIPLAFMIMEIYDRIIGLIFPSPKFFDNSPGKVFFVKPDGILESFIWDNVIMQQMYVG